jgi:hypothetical protein
MPASPAAVAAFLADLVEQGMKPSTLGEAPGRDQVSP